MINWIKRLFSDTRNRYTNGYYVHTPVKMNCPYCKTDFTTDGGFRCVYGKDLKREPVLIVKPEIDKAIDRMVEGLDLKDKPFITPRPIMTKDIYTQMMGRTIRHKKFGVLEAPAWGDSPIDPYSDLRDGMDLLKGITPIYSRREKIIDKIMEDLK